MATTSATIKQFSGLATGARVAIVSAWALAIAVSCQQQQAVPVELPDTFVVADAGDTATGPEVAWSIDANAPIVAAIGLPPACTTTWNFALPTLPAPSGDIGIEPSGKMSVVGEEEKIFLYMILPGKSTLDTAAEGPLQVQIDGGAQVLAIHSAQEGIGSVVIRFMSEGQHTLIATFADGRSGSAAIYAYKTALPVWHIEMADGVFEQMLQQAYLKGFFPATLRVGTQAYPTVQIRLHGGTSVDLPKRSFRLNLGGGSSLPDGRKRLILRGEYIDKSMLRTALSYQAFRQATWLPTPNAEFVHVRINKRFYGVMHLVDHIDGDYLKARGRNATGTLYEGDPPHELSNPGANLTPVFPATNDAKLYDKHLGPASLADLIALIEDVLLLPDVQLVKVLDLHYKVRDWLEYAALMTVLQNHEHVRKNWYMYRDHAGKDGRFETLVWDLDVTWGHLWSEKNDVFDEAITTTALADKGSKKVDSIFYNQWYRILDQPAWRKVWQQRVLELANIVLSDSFLQPRLDYWRCLLAPDLLADQRKRATNAEYLQRVDEIKAFAKGRRAFLVQQLGTP